MTLTTHALVGVAAAELFPQEPVLAFAAGFLSHLAIDSLPHYDYPLFSLQENSTDRLDKNMPLNNLFLIDLLRTGFDSFLGLMLSFLIFYYWLGTASELTVFLGVIGGILPDPLQFVYWKTRSKILLPLQRFHDHIQEGKELKNISPWLGFGLQIILLLILVPLSAVIRSLYI